MTQADSRLEGETTPWYPGIRAGYRESGGKGEDG